MRIAADPTPLLVTSYYGSNYGERAGMPDSYGRDHVRLRQDSSAAGREPVDDRRELDETACDRDVCDVHRPCLVYAFDLQASQQIGIDAMARRRLRRVRPAVDRFDPHAFHQRGDMAPALSPRSGALANAHPARDVLRRCYTGCSLLCQGEM